MQNHKILVLLATSQCDIACQYCFYTRGYEKRDGLRFDPRNAELLSRKLRVLGFSTVILTGGDPLSRNYRSDALLVTHQLQSHGIKVIICTSGAYLTEADCDEIIKTDPFRLDFSIDSYRQSVHDGLRGRFRDCEAAIKYLLTRGYRAITTTTVLTALNAPHIKETMEFLKSLGVEDRRVQPVFLPNNGPAELVLQMDTSLAGRIRQASFPGGSHTSRYISWWLHYYLPECGTPAAPKCQMGKKVFVSGARGDISACFHRPDITLGNLLQDEAGRLLEALEGHPLSRQRLPDCVGPHCVSLFDQESSWEECV